MTSKIHCSVIANPNGNIGRLTLNKPQALNALDIDMVQAMLSTLDAWRLDDSIAAVFIDSEHAKAFCAGGDIVSMYEAMVAAHEQDESPQPSTKKAPEFLAQFFEQEYKLDYCIHTYPKPVIAWGHGIIMGGGLGVFSGASIRIVTERSRVAMPEISIGLFPDVGASYFLNNMPSGVGLFLGLTAASVNAIDCINTHLAHYALLNDSKAAFITGLSTLETMDNTNIKQLASKLAKAGASSELMPVAGNLDAWHDTCTKLDTLSSLAEIAVFFDKLALAHKDDVFIQSAVATFKQGSPITAHLVFEQLQRAKAKSLAECFRMELNMALTCSYLGEFQEGVRALLIDKDKQAKWQFNTLQAVNDSTINAHFDYFAQGVNPLLILEKQYGNCVNSNTATTIKENNHG